MATCLYNEGKIAVIDVLSSLGIPVTREMVRRYKATDKLRVTKKQRAEEYGKKRRKNAPDNDDSQYAAGAGEYQ